MAARYGACRRRSSTARTLAADLLEADPADVVLDRERGAFHVAGTPAITRSWSELATAASTQLDEGILRAAYDFEETAGSFPFGSHVAVVEVDRDTGAVTLLRHVVCDDAGTIINPVLFDGQVHGGVASGISQALYEEMRYDADGNPLTANFLDYAFPAASEFPSFERVVQETPSPLNPLGRQRRRRSRHHRCHPRSPKRRRRRPLPLGSETPRHAIDPRTSLARLA